MKKSWAALFLLAAFLVGCSSPEPSEEPGPGESMRGLGYLSGYEEPPEQTGVTVHEDTAYEGLNLWVSGHKPAAYLMDMDGNVVHEWEKSWEEVFPDADLPEKAYDVLLTGAWRKVHPLPDGSVYAIFAHYGFFKLDKDSNLLWVRQANQHHDLAVADNGDVYTLTQDLDIISIHGTEALRRTDFVTVYGADGTKKEEYNLLEIFRDSQYRSALAYLRPEENEVFHTNSIRLLPEGDLLLSFRALNMVAVLDPEAGEIKWAILGRTDEQHDARLLDDGRLLLFDNGNFLKDSRVVEFENDSAEVVWQYGRQPGQRFFSECCGTAQRLENGNTLIADSDSGRVFEVTREGDVVWEFVNPHMTENGKIGAIYEMKRIPREYFTFLK